MGSWEAQYEKNLREQKMSGPLELTAEHREKNRQLRNIIADLLPIDDEQKLSDCDLLYRFLIGKGWNIKQAEKFLGGYVLLRQVESLNGILREEVEPRVQAMVSSIFGRDKEGYPNLWIALDPTKLIPLLKEMDKSVLLRAQIRVMESARFAAKECGVDRCTYVIDLGLITMSSVNTLTLGFLRDLCKIMQEYYPEIMRRMLIFNTGWAVSGAWKVLRPLVDARVQDKIRFFKGPPNMEKLEPFMDAKEIPQEFGGLGSAEKDTITQLIAAEERRLRREDRGASSHVDPMPSKRQSSLLQTATEDDEDSLHSACYSIRTPTNSSGASFQYQGDEPMHSSTSSTSNLVCAAGAGDDPALSGCSSTILVASKSVLELLEVDGPLTDIPNIPVPVSSKDKKATKSANRRSVPTRSSPKRRGAATDEGDPLSCTRSSAGGRSTGSRRRSGASTLAPIQVDLVQCGDGTIAGYHNGRRVGELRQNRIFGDAIVVQGDHEDQGGLIPLQEYNSADGGSFPSAAATTNTTSTTVEDGGEASPYSPHLPAAEVPLPTSRYLMGEILHESGHPIHRVLVVCDSARVPKFVVRQSRFRHLLSIFRVTDSVAERAHIATNARCQHFVRGERVEFGVVRRHKYAPCEDAGAWRMYSRTISTVERVMIPKFLHRRSRRDSSAHSSTGSERDGGGGATARARRSQQRHHVTNSSISSNGSSRMLSPELVKVHAGDVEDGALLAEAKGQSLWFYPPFSETHSMVDLFALALAIGKLWTGGDESDS